MDTGKLRAIQVGLSWWGRDWYSSQLAEHPSIQIEAWVDTAESTRSEATESLKLPPDRVFADITSALQAVDAEAVVIITSIAGHVPVAKEALEAGLHVLVEKPFAPSVSEARQLTELAHRVGRTLMVSQNYRFFPAPVAAAELVASGRLGRLGAIHIDFRRDNMIADPNRARHEALVHPLLADMSIHHFDLMRMVTGASGRQISCHPWNPPWSAYRDPPAAIAYVEMDNDVVVTYRGSWVSPGPVTAWAGEWHMEFEGGEAVWTSRADSTDSADRLTIAELGKRPQKVSLPKLPLIERAGSADSFVRMIRTGEENGCSAAANIGSLAMTYAAIESADSGRSVTLAPEVR